VTIVMTRYLQQKERVVEELVELRDCLYRSVLLYEAETQCLVKQDIKSDFVTKAKYKLD